SQYEVLFAFFRMPMAVRRADFLSQSLGTWRGVSRLSGRESAEREGHPAVDPLVWHVLCSTSSH
ncbi:MAG: hypothetical protein ACLQDM_16740, partial [Bradyrhizobium sp.]